MSDFSVAEQQIVVAKQINNLWIGIKNFNTLHIRVIRRETAGAIDRNKNGKAIFATNIEVIDAVARSRMHTAGAGIQRNMGTEHDQTAPVRENGMKACFPLQYLRS